MAAKLVIGDIVKLKSGGPWMTVTKDRTDAGSKFAETAWFNGAELSKEQFPKDALEPKDGEKDDGKKGKTKEAAPAETVDAE